LLYAFWLYAGVLEPFSADPERRWRKTSGLLFSISMVEEEGVESIW
jgi:hypothetical protein